MNNYQKLPQQQLEMQAQNMVQAQGMMNQQMQGMMQQQQAMMQNMQQQAMQFNQQMMQGMNNLHMMPGLDQLKSLSGVFIKQKFQLLEALTGCEQANRYMVFPADQNGNKAEPEIMYCREKSGWCERNCLHADCRPFKMDVTHHSPEYQPLHDKAFLRFERDYSCTFCCLNRPNLRVFFNEQGQDEYLGKVHSPFLCCDLGLDVQDNKNNDIYKIRGNCCQLGLICKCPCESCQTIDFQIFNNQGQQVSTLQKRTAGCVKSMISTTDNFSLKFPQESDTTARALLLASVIFLDFRYFEQKPNRRQKQGLLDGA